MSSEAARTDRELQMLESLVDCAYGLSVAVAEAAKAEADAKRSFGLYDLFLRSALAVRLGIRLSMTLRAGPRTARPAEYEQPERLEAERPDQADAPEVERPDGVESLEHERERERDYEPVSLPRFLSTLGLVARDAGRLEGLPAEVRTCTLPALQALLAHANAGPAPAPDHVRAAAGGVSVLSRPPPSPARVALLGSTATPLLPPGPRPKPRWPGAG